MQYKGTHDFSNADVVGISVPESPPFAFMANWYLFKYPTNAVYTDVYGHFPLPQNTILYWYDATPGGDYGYRNVTSDWADALSIIGAAKIGDYIYVGMYTTTGGNETRVYRYAAKNIGAGGTQMTINTLGTTANPIKMISDGTYLYFNNDGGDTASSNHIFEKFSISGTTLTQVSKITCGSTSADFTWALLDNAGNFYGYSSTYIVRRFNSSGTLQATATSGFNPSNMFVCAEGVPYLSINDGSRYHVSFTKVPLLP